ncbi:MAG: DUF1990 family protein, partial [Bdellovibrionaceae bacterium]|nr:DUF1990 family protein [Pseudobdellovibrionaceae bacterium]
AGSIACAEAAMQELQRNPDQFSPQLLATFEKIRGSSEELRKQDEFQIHITGPWNGPVKVSDVTAHTFTLATLEGHLEAGVIKFRICTKDDGKVLFEIESLARSRDAVVDFFYDKLPIAKLAQTEMWCAFCKAFAKKAMLEDGRTDEVPEVEIITERRDEDTGQWQKL